mgnify:FL=1
MALLARILLVSLTLASGRARAVEVPPSARSSGAVRDGTPHVRARLLADQARLEPGDTFRAGVLFELAPHWHIYWKDPGESGMATRVRFEAAQATFDPLRWPAYKTFLDPSGRIKTNGYADQVLLWARGRVGTDASDALHLRARVSYLACRVECIPGKAVLERTLPVVARAKPQPDAAKIFGRYPPAPADYAPPAPVRITKPDAAAAAPQKPPATSATAAQPAPPSDPPAASARRDSPETAAASAAASSALALWQVVVLALLGGMVLNLMPCVFPVLAIKVFAFVNLAHTERGSLATHSLAYLGGILAAMLVLAATVVGIQWAGQEVGWGFQFQNPAFIVALSVLLVLFALELFGVFHVSLGSVGSGGTAGHSGPARSFAEGVLAVVLSTPCSAPFLGTAVGFALTSQPHWVFAVFATIGVGLALPFIVLTAMPGWTRVLPRPGAWMIRFKQLLGFALLGTVLWLAWILGRFAGADGVIRLVAVLLAVALAGWAVGIAQGGGYRRLGLAASTGIIWVGVAAWLFAPWSVTARAPTTATAAGASHWQAYTRDAVRAALDAGKVAFVDFTADWCITCKVNEQTVLEIGRAHV